MFGEVQPPKSFSMMDEAETNEPEEGEASEKSYESDAFRRPDRHAIEEIPGLFAGYLRDAPCVPEKKTDQRSCQQRSANPKQKSGKRKLLPPGCLFCVFDGSAFAFS